MRFTMTDLAKCAEREVGQRQHVYPRLVASGRMSQAKAGEEIAKMQAIAEHLREQAKGEQLL